MLISRFGVWKNVDARYDLQSKVKVLALRLTWVSLRSDCQAQMVQSDMVKIVRLNLHAAWLAHIVEERVIRVRDEGGLCQAKNAWCDGGRAQWIRDVGER